jgi:hypothetical protein
MWTLNPPSKDNYCSQQYYEGDGCCGLDVYSTRSGEWEFLQEDGGGYFTGQSMLFEEG